MPQIHQDITGTVLEQFKKQLPNAQLIARIRLKKSQLFI